MDHSELNWRSANWHSCFSDSAPIRYLAAASFLSQEDLAAFAKDIGLSTTFYGPLALILPFQFPRMAAQMSRFTIHISRDPEAQIAFLLRGTSLVWYFIPAKTKPALAKQLARLGFWHDTLYRSLDSLGRTIKDEILRSFAATHV